MYLFPLQQHLKLAPITAFVESILKTAVGNHGCRQTAGASVDFVRNKTDQDLKVNLLRYGV